MRNRFIKYVGISSLCIALTACGTPSSKDNSSSNEPGISRDEQNLRKQSEAFNRTLVEGVVAGAVLGGLTGFAIGGEEKVDDGILFGALAGLAAGTYVASLQKKYSTDEDRLEKLQADVDKANAEAAATLITMRKVRDQQLAELAAARQSNDAAALQAEQKQAAANEAEMRKTISGAEGQYSELSSTRALKLSEEQETGIDPQLNELANRITAMRQIAETLAADA